MSSLSPSTSSSAARSSAPPGGAALPPLKLLLLGDSGVGKTSLMSCFADDGQFSPNMLSTAGVDCRVKPLIVDGRSVVMQIWDTAGQERFKTITRQYYRGAMGIMLVFDCTSTQSFEHVEYWLQSIQQYAHQSVGRVLIGNKSDTQRTHTHSQTRTRMQAAAADHPSPRSAHSLRPLVLVARAVSELGSGLR